jgi:signal transduction histidine kinase
MNAPVLTGLFAGWTAVQIAVGAFFVQVYASRQRELEYLIFGLVCFAVALTDAGFAIAGAIHGPHAWPATQLVTHSGALAATALNFHFVLQLVAPNQVRRFAPVVYALHAACAVVLFSDGWWIPGTLHDVNTPVLAITLHDVRAQPTPLGNAAYAMLMTVDGFALLALVVAYRRGRREILGAIIGLVAVMVCAVIDVVTITQQLATPPLWTYGFLLYGVGVANTLLVRYRRAAEELELTAKELRTTTEELTNSYLELSSVQEELFRKKQLASVGELAASIAHEVRNPLAVIVNAAANLKRPSLGAEDRSTLFGIIEEEITRLNNIVTDLLRYARPVNVQREEVPLPELIRSLSESFAKDHGLSLEVSTSPEAATVWADPSLLRLALQNLIDNARQAVPKGAVAVHAEKAKLGDGWGVRIDVSDTGPGMDSRTLERAMDPFFSTRPSGTGLGLPITARIVEAHGGHIEITSRIGEGTTASLFVPAKRAERLSDHRNTPDPRA